MQWERVKKAGMAPGARASFSLALHNPANAKAGPRAFVFGGVSDNEAKVGRGPRSGVRQTRTRQTRVRPRRVGTRGACMVLPAHPRMRPVPVPVPSAEGQTDRQTDRQTCTVRTGIHAVAPPLSVPAGFALKGVRPSTLSLVP